MKYGLPILWIALFLMALAHAEEPSSPAQTLLAEGDKLFASRAYAKATTLYEQAIAAAEKAGEAGTLVEALSMTARGYLIRKKKEEGRPFIERAAKLAKDTDPQGWSRYLGVRGRFEWRDDDKPRAAKTFEAMYEYSLKRELWRRAVDAAHMVAIVGSHAEQLVWAKKGISAAEKGGMDGWLGPLWNNLGNTYDELKRPQEALDAWVKARHYHWKVGTETNKLVADWAVGLGHRKVGGLDLARQWQRPVLAWAERRLAEKDEPDRREWVALAQLELGLIASAQGRLQDARALLVPAHKALDTAGMKKWHPAAWAELEAALKRVGDSSLGGSSAGALAPSLRDRALAALSEGQHDEAIALYLRWLEADPQDANSRYNLACLYALQKKVDLALDALQTSIEAGFTDFDHARKDPDLTCLRNEKAFLAALASGEARQADNRLANMHRHALKTESIGTYIVLLPPDYETSKREYPVVFILHGSGSSETGHARVAEVMGREGVIYVAPRALHPHVGAIVASGEAGWTAWPPERSAEASPDPMRLYTDWVVRCADDVARRYRVDRERVFAWGHCQGAAAANVLAALHPKRIAGYFAYAGYYPDLITDETLAGLKAEGVTVELCHGEQDRVVDPGPTRTMEDRLAKAGVEHAVHMIQAQHRITQDVERLSQAWMKKRVRVPAKAGDGD